MSGSSVVAFGGCNPILCTPIRSRLLSTAVSRRDGRHPCLWEHIRDRISQDYLPATAVRLVNGAARWLPSRVVANSVDTLAH